MTQEAQRSRVISFGNRSDEDHFAAGAAANAHKITTLCAPQTDEKIENVQNDYTLSEFVNTFDLPRTAKVVRGHYGIDEPTTISQGILLLLCCRKATKTVMAVDANETAHNIPCDSSLVCVPLDTTYGLQGHVYSSVNEILSCRDLPKVVYIDSKTASDLCLNNTGQLIFPYQREQDQLGRTSLVCYDQRNTKFKLPPAEHGFFSTKPDYIKMDVESCIKHIREFPYSIAKYNDADGTKFTFTDYSTVTLTGMMNKQSVMAKVMSEDGKHDIGTVEIPVNTPIILQCLPANVQASENKASVYQSPEKFQNDPYTSIKPRTKLPGEYTILSAPDGSNEKLKTSQDPLYEHLPGEDQTLQQPLISQTPHSLNTIPHDDQNSRQSSGQFPIPPPRKKYREHNNSQPHHHTSRGSMVENHNNATYTVVASPDEYDDVINQPSPTAYEQPTSPTAYEQPTSPTAYEQLTSPAVYEQPQEQLEHIQKLEANNQKLLTEVTQLQACVNELIHLVVTKNPTNNIRQLSSMDVDMVLIVLREMGLSEYNHIFRENNINGKKLAHLDGIKLSRYGITNTKDQEGLLDLIKGRASPLFYLLRLPSNNTAESYVQFTKTFRKLNIYY